MKNNKTSNKLLLKIAITDIKKYKMDEHTLSEEFAAASSGENLEKLHNKPFGGWD